MKKTTAKADNLKNAQPSARNSAQQSSQHCLQKNYQKIWQTVQLIPVGKVATYGQIADLAGLPGRARLVGRALGGIPELGWNGKPVPWHRVINAQGKISFPVNSDGFVKQIKLLQSEQVVVLGKKIKLGVFQWQPDLSELLFSLTF